MSSRAILPIVAASLTLSACTPSAATGTSPPASASASAKDAACWPWDGRGFTLKAHAFAMAPQNVMDLGYDDATGALRLHASGSFVKEPQVVDRTVTLAEADRAAVAGSLLAICPDDKARAARCAPGGCSSIEVTPKGGAARSLENDDSVAKITARLRPFFPELR
jgi:hypothetical protein